MDSKTTEKKDLFPCMCRRKGNSGDRTRTCDLKVMSLASCHLLYPAVYIMLCTDTTPVFRQRHRKSIL